MQLKDELKDSRKPHYNRALLCWATTSAERLMLTVRSRTCNDFAVF